MRLLACSDFDELALIFLLESPPVRNQVIMRGWFKFPPWVRFFCMCEEEYCRNFLMSLFVLKDFKLNQFKSGRVGWGGVGG